MQQRLTRGHRHRNVVKNPDLRDWGAHGPLGLVGRPDEIATTVSRLISPKASYLTGSDITVTAGL